MWPLSLRFTQPYSLQLGCRALPPGHLCDALAAFVVLFLRPFFGALALHAGGLRRVLPLHAAFWAAALMTAAVPVWRCGKGADRC